MNNKNMNENINRESQKDLFNEKEDSHVKSNRNVTAFFYGTLF